MNASGWAVRYNSGLIDVSTVSATRRAAVVNWLVIEEGYPITNCHTDDQIETWWNDTSHHKFAEVIEVEIVAK